MLWRAPRECTAIAVEHNPSTDTEKLRPILSDIIQGEWQAEPLDEGKSGGRVIRVRPEHGEPVVVKLLHPGDVAPHLKEDYPGIAASEFNFYTGLLPRLGLPTPTVLAAGLMPDGTFYLVLEDLATGHLLFPADHAWGDRELQPIMRTYALLHGRSLQYLRQHPSPPWLAADPRALYNPDLVLNCIGAFATNSWTAETARSVARAPGLEALVRGVATALADEPPAVLYNDFYPANVAVPVTGGLAKLFDWQLVGTGPIHVDIINIGLLGRDRAFAAVDRAALLDLYLDALADETGYRPGTDAFRKLCGTATLLGWGVFMPRMVKNMQQCNAESREFSPSMARLFRDCMADWSEALCV